MNFASDNWSGASKPVMAALAAANQMTAPSYGGDAISKRVRARFAEIFEHDVAVFFVATGSAANALSLAAYARPGGVVLCEANAHIACDEANAVEFFSSGNKLHLINGAAGKLTPRGIQQALEAYPPGVLHHGRPIAMSLSQATEAGTLYTTDEITSLTEIAKDHGLACHLDGARFANAAAAENAAPSDLTWRAGIDVVSFGGTKNGCLAAEAVIFFDPAMAEDVAYAQKRAGQLFSKERFIAAQFEAYLTDGHWLDLARRANASAARLAEIVDIHPHMRCAFPVQANEVFVILTRNLANKLREHDVTFYEWRSAHLDTDNGPKTEEICVRFVTSYATETAEIERFAALIAGHP